jgi:hypothetical protein
MMLLLLLAAALMCVPVVEVRAQDIVSPTAFNTYTTVAVAVDAPPFLGYAASVSAIQGNSLLLLGGVAGSNDFTQVWSFSLTANVWQKLGPCPIPIYMSGLVKFLFLMPNKTSTFTTCIHAGST